MYRGRRDRFARPLIEYSAICLTGTETSPELKAICVGKYQNDHELRKEIDSRTPPPILRPYMVLGIIATSLADNELGRMSKLRRIPIAKNE